MIEEVSEAARVKNGTTIFDRKVVIKSKLTRFDTDEQMFRA